jgi:hypothetical protein
MKKQAIILILTLIIATLLCGVVSAANGEWEKETIDNTDVSENSLVLDSSDNPYVSYYDNTNHDLKYAYQKDGTWYTEILDGTGDVGQYNSLKIDSSGTAHISYYDATNQQLKYANRGYTSCSTEIVDNTALLDTSIALDSTGMPHIIYTTSNNILKYAYKIDPLNWHIESLNNLGNVGSCSLALDSTNNPHISYYDNTNQDLKYATKISGTWNIQTVDSNGIVGNPNSLALDSTGTPHISYWNFDTTNVKYAYWTGSSWETEDIDTIVAQMSATLSLALDNSNNPHISYYKWWGYGLMYASKLDGNWDIQNVASGDLGVYPFIAIDSAGTPHITYSGSLDYAYFIVNPVNPTNPTDPSNSNKLSSSVNSSVKAINSMKETLGMQTTGTPTGMLIASLLFAFAGAITLRIKN